MIYDDHDPDYYRPELEEDEGQYYRPLEPVPISKDDPPAYFSETARIMVDLMMGRGEHVENMAALRERLPADTNFEFDHEPVVHTADASLDDLFSEEDVIWLRVMAEQCPVVQP